MLEKSVDALVQSGALGAALFLMVWYIGKKLDRLTDEVSALHGKISVLLDREPQR